MVKNCTRCNGEFEAGGTQRKVCEVCQPGGKTYYERRDNGWCTRCGMRPQKIGFECQTCKELSKKRIREKARLLRSDQRSNLPRNCSICLTQPARSERKTCAHCADRNVRYSLRLREMVFREYGGCCKCCGETITKLLTIDHVNSDGYVERRAGLAVTGSQFYKRIRDLGFPDNYQILCWNCNMGRAKNGGICPHKDFQNCTIEPICSYLI